MQEIHLGGRQRIKSQEMAFTGLFAALIAAGAYMRIDIPVSAISHAFYAAVLFLCFWQASAGGQTGSCCVCVYLAVGLAGIPVFAAAEAGVSDPSYLWFF